jgi:uncharacterized protein (TIGR04255 family)
VGNYSGWDVFLDRFYVFLTQLNLVLKNIIARQIGVRFINKLDEKTVDQTVGFWLAPSKNYPENILSVQGDYFYKCKWFLNSEQWVQICIAESEPLNKHIRPLIFDIDVAKLLKTPLELSDSLTEIASVLHDEVYDIFETSLTPNYKKILNKAT